MCDVGPYAVDLNTPGKTTPGVTDRKNSFDIKKMEPFHVYRHQQVAISDGTKTLLWRPRPRPRHFWQDRGEAEAVDHSFFLQIFYACPLISVDLVT